MSADNESCRDSLERLREGIAFANIGVWDLNIVTGEFYWSEKVAPMFGYHDGKVETSFDNFIAAVHPNDRERVRQAIQACLDNGEEYDIEHRVVWSDGTVHWVRESGNVKRDKDGKPVNMMGVVQDVSAQRKVLVEMKHSKIMLEEQTKNLAFIAEEVQKHRERADAANRAKSMFLANMSHEIRTPINAILGLAYLAMDTQLDEKQYNYISNIHISAQLLLEIINDILDFSKIEAGKVQIEQAEFQLTKVFNHISNILGHRVEKKGLRLVFDIPQGLPEVFIGDSLRLGQVLLNLSNNSVKFSEEGEIKIGVSVQEQDATQIVLHFSVHDHGIGLTEDQLNILFRPFTQADSSTTRKYGGTGLGLAICKSLVEAMGGNIWVESEYHQGSIFHFTVPLLWKSEHVCSLPSQELEQPPALITDAAPPDWAMKVQDAESIKAVLNGAKIMLVEDNEINMEVALELLRSVGIEVVVAMDGRQALKLLEGVSVDGILMDCQMPVMDGYAATKAIRSNAAFAYLPIIAMTANVMDGDREMAMAAGMNDYVTKPIVVNELFSTLARWLQLQPQKEKHLYVSDQELSHTLPEHIEGIDLAAGMAVVQGNQSLYRRLFTKFAAGYGNFEQEYRQLYADEDQKEVIRLVHTLKGVAGNLGANDLYRSSQALEQALRTEQSAAETEIQLFQLLEHLNVVMHGIDLLRTEDDWATTKADINPGKFNEIAGRLRTLLADSDFDAYQVFEELRNLAGMNRYNGVIKQISDGIEAYDYRRALEELDELIAICAKEKQG